MLCLFKLRATTSDGFLLGQDEGFLLLVQNAGPLFLAQDDGTQLLAKDDAFPSLGQDDGSLLFALFVSPGLP